jgi:hypothetical protein
MGADFTSSVVLCPAPASPGGGEMWVTVWRRPKSFPLMTKPRAEAREEVQLNGHAKKLK